MSLVVDTEFFKSRWVLSQNSIAWQRIKTDFVVIISEIQGLLDFLEIFHRQFTSYYWPTDRMATMIRVYVMIGDVFAAHWA